MTDEIFPHQTPSSAYKKQSDALACPVCGVEVEYLLGEDTDDGGKKGCEKCWKAPKTPVRHAPVEEPQGKDASVKVT